MTKPEHVRRWWGCLDERYSVTVCEIDLRPGGAWRFVGRGPQGEYAFHGEYREIAAPDRIVFTEIFEPFPDVESVVTQILAEEGGKTRLTVRALYPSLDVRDIGAQDRHGKGRWHQLRPSRRPRAGIAGIEPSSDPASYRSPLPDDRIGSRIRRESRTLDIRCWRETPPARSPTARPLSSR